MNDIDITRLATSWTKYDIVQVLDVIYSVDTIEKYKKEKNLINEPILKSFLGIKTLDDPIPHYWIEIQKFSNKEKKLFALLALIFTHYSVIDDFANIYSKGGMRGCVVMRSGEKGLTNLRSALVSSEATDPSNRRAKEVPYDLSPLYYNADIGPLFKELLIQRFALLGASDIKDNDFYAQCLKNKFPQAMSLTKSQFRNWLEGLSLNKGVYVKELKIENFLSISNPFKLCFEEAKEIYFLGENGDGKTILLMAIYLAFNGNLIKKKLDKTTIGPSLAILDKNISISGKDDLDFEYSPDVSLSLKNLYGYGTHRGRYSSDEFEQHGYMSLFDNDQTLINPEQWIKNLQLEQQKKERKTVRLAIDKLKSVIKEILNKDVDIKITGSQVKFVEKGYEETISELSEGYRSIIIFICDLLYRLYTNNPTSPDLFKISAVVLIDEIDQHLHLKWQRSIVGKLRNLFPNIQFFMTTHSPTIIQGASDDSILYRIYRENGVTRISEPYDRKDFNYMMMNTLVTSSIFGLSDSRLQEDNNLSDTSNNDISSKIYKRVQKKLKEDAENGKEYINDDDVDNIIDNVLKDI
jgi:hypothetical protein